MSNAATVSKSRTKLRALCESAIFVAIAVVLNMIRINVLPQGGSVNLVLIPLVILSIRWGLSWGLMAGFVFGLLKAVLGEGFAWGWQSLLLDYFVAYTVIGLAGLFFRRAGTFAVLAVFLAGFAQYAVFWLAGGLIWAEWMPEAFLGLPMANPWFYSLLYNGVHMLPNILICAVLMGVLTVPLGKYLRGEDIA
ncbi:MAG: energy-coupled thiamine transporter ThiT [Oscillospiraceae bacterium]|nr:energy-coupled thiamine transporter ThiT [Oscillospiraceae bacterium]